VIREWRINRFKSIAGQTALTFRRLTLLAGANSSGKSSVIQSILLMTQSLASRVPEKQLVLNGEQVKLGTFDDVCNLQAGEQTVEFGFDLDLKWPLGDASLNGLTSSQPISPSPDDTGISLKADFVFAPARSPHGDGSPAPMSMYGEILTAAFRSAFRYRQNEIAVDDDDDASADLHLERRDEGQIEQALSLVAPTMLQAAGPAIRRALRYSVQLSAKARRQVRIDRADRQNTGALGEVAGVTLDHLFPGQLIWKQPALRRMVESRVRRLAALSAQRVDQTIERWTDSSDSVQAALASALSEGAGIDGKSIHEFVRGLRFPDRNPPAFKGLIDRTATIVGPPLAGAMAIAEGPLPPESSEAFEEARRYFSAIRYLGPLRDDPKPVYAMAGAVDPTDVGAKGQFTAAVLDLNANVEVSYVPPGASDPVNARLAEAVRSWLVHFDMAEHVRTSDEPKVGYRLLVRPTGIRSYVDLTNVGVGLSQLLPILVCTLASRPGNLLLFEQPELHLHPAVQSQLGDFFIAAGRAGRQCVVETHSEYLINRIRLRIAESEPGSDLESLSTIHFVERPAAASTFRSINVNGFGAILDWPKGFFDQSPNEAEQILKAALRKKARRPAAKNT
jgi:hypothetical protein